MQSCIQLTDHTKITFDELIAQKTSLSENLPKIIRLLREKKLNPEDVPKELLFLKDESGTSVLDVCIERFREPVADERGRILPRVFFLQVNPVVNFLRILERSGKFF